MVLFLASDSGTRPYMGGSVYGVLTGDQLGGFVVGPDGAGWFCLWVLNSRTRQYLGVSLRVLGSNLRGSDSWGQAIPGWFCLWGFDCGLGVPGWF